MADDLQTLKRELASADLFHNLDDLLLELIASISEEKIYQVGDVIFEENTESRELYIIAKGQVEIRVRPALITGSDAGETPQTIALLREGQNFGEITLLDEGRRTAAAVCADHGTRLIIIPRDRLLVMCDNAPKLGYKIMRNMAADLAMKIRTTDLDLRGYLIWLPAPRKSE